MKLHNYYVYILASKRNRTLYVGVTSDLRRRYYQHKYETREGFTKQYGVHVMVHFEYFQQIQSAIAREKQLKNWHRAWKIELIEKDNPQWKDLLGPGSSPG